MKIALFVLIALLTACGADPAQRTAPQIDLVLGSIVDGFKADALNHGVRPLERELSLVAFVAEFPATWQKPGTEMLGGCLPGEAKGTFEVRIKRPELTGPAAAGHFTSEGDNLNLRRLVYHELGHCLLNKGHGGKWNSIMAANFQTLNADESFWIDTVNEFFSETYLEALPDAGF